MSLHSECSSVVKRSIFKRRKIEDWVEEKIKAGKPEQITDLILLLLRKSEKRKYPVFSSFPGDLSSQVSYEMSVFKEKSEMIEDYPQKLVLRSLRHLSPTQGAIFWARYIDEQPQWRIGKILGCSQQYIAQQEKRIKAILGQDRYLKELIHGGNQAANR